MMRSLSSAVAGLRSHQTKMDVIGNNIANVNTAGFKSSRVTFSDVYYQSVTGASSPIPGVKGGTNPTQIGYGASVATIDTIIAQSGAQSTGMAMDIYMAGDGFLTTQDSKGNYMYTRLGNLGFDADGNIVDSNGNFVLGVKDLSKLDKDGSAKESVLEALNVPKEIYEKLTGISISKTGEIIGILPGKGEWKGSDLSELGWEVYAPSMNNTNYSGTVKAYIGLSVPKGGALPTWLTGIDTKGYLAETSDEGDYTFEIDTTTGIITVTVDGEEFTGIYTPGEDIELSANGRVAMVVKASDTALGSIQAADTSFDVTMNWHLDVEMYYASGERVPTEAIKLDTTQNPIRVTVAGFTFEFDPAKLEPTDSRGQAVGTIKTSQGEPYEIGYLMLAKFSNAAGLEQAGSSSFMQTVNSGDATYSRPGTDGTGGTVAGSLEMSNVDISQEFTDMITTQRGFQANTRIITVSDEMLQELVNLKR